MRDGWQYALPNGLFLSSPLRFSPLGNRFAVYSAGNVAYINSEDELEGGYQNLFYYDNKRHYFATLDNIAYDIRKMFRNYNELNFNNP